MNKILLVYEDYSELMIAESSLKKVGFDVVGVTNEYSLSEQVLSFNPDAVVGFGRGTKVTSSNIGKKMKEMNRWQGKVVLVYDPRHKPTAPELIRIRADIVLETPVTPVRLVQVLAKLLKHDEAALLEKLGKVLASEATGQDVIHVQGDYRSAKSTDEPIRVSGGPDESKSSSLFGRLKNSKELYQDETKKISSPDATSFPDVDLKEIEFELTGKSDKKVPTAFNLNNDESKVETQLALKDELKKAQDNVAARVSKYAKLTENVSISPISTVRRVEARKRQKELQKDMDSDKLKGFDELRREFTKALFKK